MKNTLNQILNSLAMIILIAIISAVFYGSAGITGAYMGAAESESSSLIKIIILSLIISCYAFFKLYFLIKNNPKRNFNKLKNKTIKFIEKELHNEAFEHYDKLKKELDRFFKK